MTRDGHAERRYVDNDRRMLGKDRILEMIPGIAERFARSDGRGRA